MRILELRIPEVVQLSDYDITMRIASKLYEDGVLSSGQAATLVGISKRAFIELLGKYGVSLFSDSIDDLYSDIENA